MNTNMYENNVNHMNTFETCNRRLEQFLFVHDIRFSEWYRNNDGLTTWVYPDNAELREVVKEFRKLDERRRERRFSNIPSAEPAPSSFQSSFTQRPAPVRQNKYGPQQNYPNPRDRKRC